MNRALDRLWWALFLTAIAAVASAAELPDPMVMNSGRKVETDEDWQARRAEMIETIEHWEYGHAPGVPEVSVKDVQTEDVLFEKSGKWARRVTVKLVFEIAVGSRSRATGPLCKLPESSGPGVEASVEQELDPTAVLTMQAGYWKPRDAAGPLPAILAMEPVWWQDPFIKNGIVERVISRGYVLAGFNHNDLASFEDPAHHPAQDAYPDCDWGVAAVGAWGYRIAMNWLETDPTVDARRVAIWGHSRRGKSCALAGALDERFAAVIPHMSGMAGTALYRVRGKGAQELEGLLERFWLHPRMFDFIDRENEIPLDQHWLHALIAPRPMLIHVGKDDAWGNPPGEQAAYDAAKPVYDFLHAPGNLTLYTGNYGHYDPNGPEGADSWENALKFLDRHFKG